MASGYFNIKYSSMDQFYSDICQKITEWNQELDAWNQSYNNMIALESFKGTSADGVKNYLQEVHGVLLFSIKQMLADYQTRFLLYKTGYYDIESNIYADLSEETIRSVISRLATEIPTIESVDSRINSALSRTQDIFAAGTPSKYYLQDTLEGVKGDLNSFCLTIDQYESSQSGVVSSDLDGLISSVKTIINDYIVNGTNIASYKSGDLAKNTYVLDLCDRVQKSSDYIKENISEIESAVQEQQEVYVQMQKDYEEACKAREDKGLANIIMGGVAIVAGAAAIIFTAGMATPIVVTACVSGGCTIAYGASNMIEGGQDMYYGSIGDLSSAAFNPIRDTVFCGNQGLYDAWGKLNMTVAGLCIPVGKAINTVAGSSTKVIVETAAKTVVKESLKDVAFDTVSGEVVKFADEKLDLNQTEEVLLNLTVNTVLDKGSDFIGEKINGKPSVAEGMSYDDAKKYNNYWDEVENGTHNPPEMDNIDMKAWDTADAKLNDNYIKNNLDTSTVDQRVNNSVENADIKESDGSFTDWERTSLTAEQEAIVRDMEQNGELDYKPSELSDAHYSSDYAKLTEQPIEIDMPYDPSKYDAEAFIEQGHMQEAGINDLTVDEYLKNYESRRDNGRSADGSDAQSDYRYIATEVVTDEIMSENPSMSYEEARSIAKESFSDSAALHNPDQIAGGDPTEIHAIGDGKVNSAYGSLWGRGRAETLYEKVLELSKNMTEEQRKSTKLNIRFNIYDKTK